MEDYPWVALVVVFVPNQNEIAKKLNYNDTICEFASKTARQFLQHSI